MIEKNILIGFLDKAKILHCRSTQVASIFVHSDYKGKIYALYILPKIFLMLFPYSRYKLA